MVSAMLYGWLQSVGTRSDTIAGLLFQLVSVWFSIAGMMWELPFARWRLGHDLSLRIHSQAPERKGLGG
jgi:hypothetical protein